MVKVCELKNISKSYSDKVILDNLSLDIFEGEMIAIVGRSGSGKTTLLNIIGLLEKSDNGIVELFGKNVTNINKGTLNIMLREKISYLFQNYALIDNDSIDKNLDVALVYSKKTIKEKEKMKKEVLAKVGLNISLKTKIYELSGGEQQRVAIARLLLKPCELILADEPTGSLDRNNRDDILNILSNLKNKGKTIVIVTHDEYIANYCDRTITI